jgi:hypothetical protein
LSREVRRAGVNMATAARSRAFRAEGMSKSRDKGQRKILREQRCVVRDSD